MSGGGKKTTTQEVRDPWGPAAPYLTDALSRVQSVANQPAQTFPGPLTVGPTDAENAAWQRQFDYNTQTFGTSPQLNWGNTAGAYQGQLAGGAYGSLAGALPGVAGATLQSLSGGPSRIGRYGFDTQLNASGMAPQFGQAGTLDARGALTSMLSGQPDYAGAQQAVEAANAPLLRSFQQDLLPSLNTRATFLNNGTGGIKTLNRVLPELGQRMSENAAGIYEGERQRALGAQQQAAGLVSQGGLSSYGLGLQGAQAQAGLGQNLAQFNLATDQARAGSQGDYRAQMLGALGQFGGFAGGANAATQGALGQSPSIYGLGQTPQDDTNRYAAWDRTLQEQNLAAQQAQFQYLRDYPQQMANWYASLIPQYGQLGGTTNTTSRTSSSMGFGDVLSGALGLASFIPGIGPAAALAGGASSAMRRSGA